MKRLFLALAAALSLGATAHSSPVNFEYTRTADPTDPAQYVYEMQFSIVVTDPGITDSFEVTSLSFNIVPPPDGSTPADPQPLRFNLAHCVPRGRHSDSLSGLAVVARPTT